MGLLTGDLKGAHAPRRLSSAGEPPLPYLHMGPTLLAAYMISFLLFVIFMTVRPEGFQPLPLPPA